MDKVLVENAKKMLDSGISKDEVVKMLVSLGYSEEEANQAISSQEAAKGAAEEEPKEEPKEREEPESKEESKEKEEPKRKPKEEPEEEEGLVVEEGKPEKEHPIEKSKEYAEHAELASTMAMNVVGSAVNKIEEHKESINALNENITKTYTKLESIPLDKISSINKDIAEIKKCLADLTAKTNVTLDLMKKILENQRELILKLK